MGSNLTGANVINVGRQYNNEVTLETYIATSRVVPISLFQKTSLGQAIGDAIAYLQDIQEGTVEVPSDLNNHSVRIVSKKDKDNRVVINYVTTNYRYPINQESRPYLGGDWKVGDIVYNNNLHDTKCVGWICMKEGTPGEWQQLGSIKPWYSHIEEVEALPEACSLQSGRQLILKEGTKRTLYYCVGEGSNYLWVQQNVSVGNEQDRPTTPQVGFWYFNTDNHRYQYYTGEKWSTMADSELVAETFEDLKARIIGNPDELYTNAKTIVGAINELYETGGGGTGRAVYSTISGSEVVNRVYATEVTNSFYINDRINPDKTEFYIMGLRIFEGLDYTYEEKTLTLLGQPLQVGQYFEYVKKDEVIVDLGTNTVIYNHKRYTAKSDGETVIQLEIDTIYTNLRVYQLGARIYEGTEYTFNPENNQITLIQPLDAGEYIDYDLEKPTGIEVTKILEEIEGIKSAEDLLLPVDVAVEGRTLVNLLGRSGNPIYKLDYDLYGVNGGVNEILTFSDSEFVIAKSGVDSLALAFKRITKPGYFLVMGESKPLVAGSTANLGYYALDNSKVVNLDNTRAVNDETNKYKTIYYKIQTQQGANFAPAFTNFSYGSNNCSIRSRYLRVYEVSKEVYDKINVDPEYSDAKLEHKFPYVDDVKCVTNPYFEIKENLIEGMKMVLGSFLGNGDPATDTAACSMHTGIRLKAGEVISFHMESPYSITYLSGYICDKVIPDGTYGGSTHLNINPTWTVPNSGEFKLYLRNENITNGTIAQFIDSVNKGETKLSIVRGSTPKKATDCYSSRMLLESRLYTGDTLSKRTNGDYVESSSWGEISLDKIDFKLGSQYTGYKGVSFHKECAPDILINEVDSDNTEPHYLVDYQGNYYSNNSGFQGSGVGLWMNFNPVPNSVWRDITFTLPNTLTGWGDGYSPTPEEIKAFFLGYRLATTDNRDLPYNGTGTKSWHKLWCGRGDKSGIANGMAPVDSWLGTTILPTVLNNQGYVPYKLIYKKSKTRNRVVEPKGVLLSKLDSTIVASSGLAVGEPTILRATGGTSGHVNMADTQYPIADIKRRISSWIKIADETGKDILFYPGLRLPGVTEVVYGERSAYMNEGKVGDRVYCDYLLYRPDTVRSFDYKLSYPDSTKSILSRISKKLEKYSEYLSQLGKVTKSKFDKLAELSNPNLLINGDFKVWQRGTLFEGVSQVPIGATYLVDRWKFNWATHESTKRVEKVSNGVKITAGAGQGYCMVQPIESGLKPGNYTISAKMYSDKVTHCQVSIRDGSAFNSSVIASSSMAIHDGFLEFNFELVVDTGIVTLVLEPVASENSVVVIEYVKLEVGTRATKLVPRLYAEELSMCQRYYEKSSYVKPYNGLYISFAVFVPMQAEQCIADARFNTEKRVDPRLTLYNPYGSTGNARLYRAGADITIDMSTVKFTRMGITQCKCPTSAITPDERIVFNWEADAEIY